MSPRTLDTIEIDEHALDALLEDVGGDLSEEEAEAAIDRWLDELGEEREAKLNGYARRIQALEAAAEAKKAEERRLAQQRKGDESSAEWLKRRLLAYVQRRGMLIKGKDTRQVETKLFRFVETKNGGKRPIRYLVEPLSLPEKLRKDVITIHVYSDQEEVFRSIHELLVERMPTEDVVVERSAQPREEEVRAALETEDPESEIHRYARLEPRGVRLAIR